MEQREQVWNTARGTPAEEKQRKALDKARTRATKIRGQRDLDATKGKLLLDEQKFEEVNSTSE